VGLVHSGGVAGFPIPPLRYQVGGVGAVGVTGAGLRLLHPLPGATLDPAASLRFAWTASPGAVLYRLEVESAGGESILEAIRTVETLDYDAPDWLAQQLSGAAFRWRVVALGASGTVVTTTPWRAGEVAAVEP
jgi:hypothetical protein